MDCPICFNQFQTSDMRMTPCSHQFCQTCLDEWLEDHNTCPICRTHISANDDNYDITNLTNMIENNLTNIIENNLNNIIENNLNTIIFNNLNHNLNENMIDNHRVVTVDDIIDSLNLALTNNDIELFEDLLEMIFEDNYLNTNHILNIVQNSNINNMNNYLSLVQFYESLYNI